MRNAERLENNNRREQTARMADENDQNPDMKQVAAPHELPAAQQLAGLAPPGILFPVEADQAADQKHRQADIRVYAKQKSVDPLAHGFTPSCCVIFALPESMLRTIWLARGHSSFFASPGPKRTSVSSQA